MPPAPRKKTTPPPPGAEHPKTPDGVPACPLCFPGGRLPEGATSGGCEHGTWTAEAA
jgi:hypothetical protein